MKKFAFIDNTGSIQYTATPSDDSAFTSGAYYNNLLCQEFDYAVEDTVAINTLYWKAGWRTRTSKPNPIFVWDNELEQWKDPRTLQDLKDAKWTTIKRARSQAEYAGFTWDGSTFDSDALSQNRITGAVTLAQMSSSFTIDWILADNTVRTLNQISMLQVGATLGQHVGAVFTNGVLRRAAIDAAVSVEEVEAVVW